MTIVPLGRRPGVYFCLFAALAGVTSADAGK